MPNWVFGFLTVEARTRKPRKGDEKLTIDTNGKVSDLAAFIDHAMTPGVNDADRLPFDFKQFIPTPGEWDTKWNACDSDVDLGIEIAKTTHSITYRFNTAWSPPIKVIKKASEMFPKLKFLYECEEEANLFDPFRCVFKAGKETSFVSWKPEEDSEDE